MLLKFLAATGCEALMREGIQSTQAASRVARWMTENKILGDRNVTSNTVLFWRRKWKNNRMFKIRVEQLEDRRQSLQPKSVLSAMSLWVGSFVTSRPISRHV